VLARGAVSASTLQGLTTGLTVNNSTGTQVGTVSQVVTGTDGSIRQVIVTGANGKTYRLAPTTLSISGNVVTTTSTSIGG
jgi:sporulation protein YlmC with PRC-barrel domain